MEILLLSDPSALFHQLAVHECNLADWPTKTEAADASRDLHKL